MFTPPEKLRMCPKYVIIQADNNWLYLLHTIYLYTRVIEGLQHSISFPRASINWCLPRKTFRLMFFSQPYQCLVTEKGYGGQWVELISEIRKSNAIIRSPEFKNRATLRTLTVDYPFHLRLLDPKLISEVWTHQQRRTIKRFYYSPWSEFFLRYCFQ